MNGHDTLVATSARRCVRSIGGGEFRGSPDFTAVLLHQSDIPKLASRRDLCFLSYRQPRIPRSSLPGTHEFLGQTELRGIWSVENLTATPREIPTGGADSVRDTPAVYGFRRRASKRNERGTVPANKPRCDPFIHVLSPEL